MVVESDVEKTDRTKHDRPVPSGTEGAFCQDKVIAFLSSDAAFGAGPVDVRETHISFIFLAGEKVYKLKRNIKLHFLDFSSLENGM